MSREVPQGRLRFVSDMQRRPLIMIRCEGSSFPVCAVTFQKLLHGPHSCGRNNI
jgi:hypothetical protein